MMIQSLIVPLTSLMNCQCIYSGDNFHFYTECLKDVSLDKSVQKGEKKKAHCIHLRGNYSCPLLSGRDSIVLSLN